MSEEKIKLIPIEGTKHFKAPWVQEVPDLHQLEEIKESLVVVGNMHQAGFRRSGSISLTTRWGAVVESIKRGTRVFSHFLSEWRRTDTIGGSFANEAELHAVSVDHRVCEIFNFEMPVVSEGEQVNPAKMEDTAQEDSEKLSEKIVGSYHYTVPLYGNDFYVSIGETLQDAVNQVTGENGPLPSRDMREQYRAFCFRNQDMQAVAICVHIDDIHEFGVIGHELIHAAGSIMDWCGVQADWNNDEAFAYLYKWMFDQYLEIINSKKQS